jgi:hemoglobin/transferrin/lactoferrin receptor protein
VNIRGLNEQRLVALVDGNRIETATDLAAGLSMVDMTDLQRIEVIKGAASSIYGTGAMGGVVNFVTKKGRFASEPYVQGNLASSFQSVNNMLYRKLSVTAGNDFGYLRLSGMARNAGDIQTPEGIMPNSQFRDNNLSLDAGLKPFRNHTLELQFQRFHAEDVGIPGGAPFPGPATATYPEEKRTLYSAKYTIDNLLPSLREFSVKYYHQYILRDVRLTGIPSQKVNDTISKNPQKFTPQGHHHTDGLKIKTNWELPYDHNLVAGIDFWQRKLNTKREKYIYKEKLNDIGEPVDTIAQIVRGEKPIPKSRFGSGGVFLQDEFSLLDDNLEVTLGGRYDLIRVYNEKAFDPAYLILNGNRMDPPPNQRVTFEQQTVYNQSWSANLGLLYNVTNDLDLTLTLGRSFRSPSLEERYKYIDLGNKVRIGDPELEPEEGYTADAGLRIWKSGFHFRVNGFVNRFTNMIVKKPDEYVYTYSTGPQAGNQDTLPALKNSNVDQALLYGFDMKMDYQLTNHLVLHGSASFVRGRDTKNGQNLPLIPPLNGWAGIKYHFPEHLTVDVYSKHYAQQEKTAKGEEVTPGYSVYNLSVYTPNFNLRFAKLKLTGGVENIFDRAYRNHLSTNRGTLRMEPGRNFFVKARLQF